MISHLQWDSQQQRWQKQQLVMFYKIINNFVGIDPTTYLQASSSRNRVSHNLHFAVHGTLTDCRKFSFSPRTVSVWNRLPATAAEAPSLVYIKHGALYPYTLISMPATGRLIWWVKSCAGRVSHPGAPKAGLVLLRWVECGMEPLYLFLTLSIY